MASTAPRLEKEFYPKTRALTATVSVVTSGGKLDHSVFVRLFLCFLLQFVPSLLKGDTGAVILQYHHVSTETPAVTSISPESFQTHIETIVKQGYQVMPLDVIVARLLKRKALPDKTVAITFDDAYKNIFTNAYPILKKHNLPFTVFVATDYVTEDSSQFLSWNELREMSANGAFIANHTASHTHLLRRQQHETKGDWLKRIEHEILNAEKTLENKLPERKQAWRSRRLLAYPYGEYDTDIQRLIEKLDYVAFGQQSGAAGINSDFSALPRFPLSGKYSDHESFKIKLATLPLPILNERRNPLLAGDDSTPLLDISFLSDEIDISNLRCFGPDGTLELHRMSGNRVSTRVNKPLPVGRSRYNCTMPVPGADPERFYWFSQLWIRKNADDSWYPED